MHPNVKRKNALPLYATRKKFSRPDKAILQNCPVIASSNIQKRNPPLLTTNICLDILIAAGRKVCTAFGGMVWK